MKRPVILPLAISLFAFGCGDAAKSAAPTEPESAPAPSLSISGDAESSTLSSVCVVYIDRRDALKAQLAAEPTNVELKDRIASYDEYINDSCSQ